MVADVLSPRDMPRPYDVEAVRRDFPALAQTVNKRPLVYLDNAASSQTPSVVVDAIRDAYLVDRSNIHRGVHTLSQRATQQYEAARAALARYIKAPSARDIVFTRGTTEAINLVAQTWGAQNVKPGDQILITALEHHSNIVPWQMLCERTGAKLLVAPVTDAGDIDLDAFAGLLSKNVRLVAFNAVSNALGTVNPVAEIVGMVRAKSDAKILIDGAQAVPHQRVDVVADDADFYVFSAHKMYGPTGMGVLYGRTALLESMPPWQGGGDMIASVTFERSTYAEPPGRFEAGTPHIVGGIALGAAVAYLEHLDATYGLDTVFAHDHDVTTYAAERLRDVRGVRLVGTPKRRAGAVSFVIDQDGLDVHPMDLGTLLDKQGVAVRTGHHCAEPLMHRLGVSGTARASFALYNTRSEVDALCDALHTAIDMLA